MSTDRKIPKLVTLLVSLLTLASAAHAGDDRPSSCGQMLSSSKSCTSAQCVPVKKVTPIPDVAQSSVAYRGCGSGSLIPVSYVEPGPIRAIAFYAAGLIKSTIAAPFRLVETLIPVGKGDDYRPVRPACQPSCGPNLPPQVIKEYEFPPMESSNLVSGLWNLPSTLFRQGRLTGDVFRNDPSAPVHCAR